MTKTIEIIVRPTGETSVQTRGFAGASCREASRFIEEALGRCGDQMLTGEFFQATEQRVGNQQHI